MNDADNQLINKQDLASILRDATNTSAIMRELGDLKRDLAINSTKTEGIEKSVSKIEETIKDYPNRREFNLVVDRLNSIESDVGTLKEFRWKLAGVTAMSAAVMTFAGQLLIKYLTK